MNSDLYEKIVWQITNLLTKAEEDLNTYTYKNTSSDTVQVKENGINAFQVSTNGFVKGKIMADINQWYLYLVNVISAYKPELKPKLRCILDTSMQIEYESSEVDINGNYYGVPENNDQNLVKIQQFRFIDFSGGHAHDNEDQPEFAATQRADRLISNPAYNLDLYINGQLYGMLGLPNIYAGISKDSLLRVPNNETVHSQNDDLNDGHNDGHNDSDQQTYYSERWIPQFMDAVVKKFEATIGHGKEIPNLSSPLLSPLGEDSGETVTSMNYEHQMEDSSYTELNHHTVEGLANSNDLYLTTLTGILASYGLSPSDQDVAGFIYNTSLRLPPVRDLETNITYVRNLGSEAYPINTALTAHFGMGGEFTPAVFPDGYGAHTGAGDIMNFTWHWNGEASPVVPDGKKVYIKTDYYADIDLKKLYDQKVALVDLIKLKYQFLNNLIPDTNQFVQGIFSQFGLNHTYQRGYHKDIHIMWSSIGQNAAFNIPPGKSIAYSKSNMLPSKAKLVYVYPHCHDHCCKVKLVAEVDGENTKITSCYPNNSSTYKALHDRVDRYLHYGDKTSGYLPHNHSDFSPGHLPPGGLNHAVYAPGSNGFVIDEPGKTILRTIGRYNSPHEDPIDQMALYFVYFEKLE